MVKYKLEKCDESFLRTMNEIRRERYAKGLDATKPVSYRRLMKAISNLINVDGTIKERLIFADIDNDTKVGRKLKYIK